MTDRDNSSGRFLERWSRKKIEGEREAPDAAAEGTAKPKSPSEPAGVPEPPADNDTRAPAKAVPKPEFDLASLPSLDSITAVTDIRAFLAPGVPKELARAALRRAWSADPAIRDFKGLAENDWDFTDPAAMPGFGTLPAGYDITKLMTQIFGEKSEAPLKRDPAPDEAASQMAKNADKTATPVEGAGSVAEEKSDSSEVPADHRRVVQADIVQRDNNIAPHNSIPGDEAEERKKRRQHGGALPQ